jgi:hypothetical protein
MKATLLDNVPLPVVTSIVPVVAPAGTVALMSVAETTVNVAGVPLKLTLVVPVRPFPKIEITRPAAPKPGFARTKAPSPTDRL